MVRAAPVAGLLVATPVVAVLVVVGLLARWVVGGAARIFGFSSPVGLDHVDGQGESFWSFKLQFGCPGR